MAGTWGVGGDERLTIKIFDGTVVISSPEIEEYWIELTNAKISAESIHFVQKHFQRSEELSPFNGVPCNCSIKLIENEKLEFSFVTDLTAETEILERISEPKPVR